MKRACSGSCFVSLADFRYGHYLSIPDYGRRDRPLDRGLCPVGRRVTSEAVVEESRLETRVTHTKLSKFFVFVIFGFNN